MVLQISHSSKAETTITNIAEMSTHSPTYTCIYLYKDMKTSCPYGFPIIVFNSINLFTLQDVQDVFIAI